MGHFYLTSSMLSAIFVGWYNHNFNDFQSHSALQLKLFSSRQTVLNISTTLLSLQNNSNFLISWNTLALALYCYNLCNV